MNFYVLTLFPEMVSNIVNTSITGRAIRNGLMQVETVNIRDFAVNKNGRVDDYPYGGGAGMVMEAEPVYRAIQSVREKSTKKPRVVYMTPQAQVLNQVKVEELAGEEELVILCGHYEGIDDRVLQECVDDYISIGDYVLTGGELGAAVLIDAVSRFVPGVLSNDESSQFESLQDNLLEYPHYTRPDSWHDKEVPKVLLSGDHTKIESWRLEQSVARTKERRPDLLEHYFRIRTLSYGDASEQELYEKLAYRISRYADVMDYNRRKLQKTRLQLDADDLLLIPAYTNASDEISFEERMRNLRGKNTPVVLLVPKASCSEMDESESGTNTNENRTSSFGEDVGPDLFLTGENLQKEDKDADEVLLQKTIEFLEKYGFRVPMVIPVSTDMSDLTVNQIALRIREKTLQFQK